MAHVSDTLLCKPRNPAKKGAARRLRESGWVPAVAYGPNHEVEHLALNAHVFQRARAEHGLAHIYDIQPEVEEGERSDRRGFKALIKSMDRNPLTREMLHVDLYAVDMTREIRIQVRVVLLGKAAGIVEGGLLQQVSHTIEVQCLPDKIPAAIEYDVTEMALGDAVHVSDLQLPEGVHVTEDAGSTIAVLAAAEEEVEETPEVGEGLELAEGEAVEGEAAEGEAGKEDKDAEAKGAKEGDDKK